MSRMQLYRESLPTLEATPLQDVLSAAGLHSGEEAVNSFPSSDFWLKSTLWHGYLRWIIIPVGCGCQLRWARLCSFDRGWQPYYNGSSPAPRAMPGSVAVARQPLELKSLVRIQAGQQRLAQVSHPLTPRNGDSDARPGAAVRVRRSLSRSKGEGRRTSETGRSGPPPP